MSELQFPKDPIVGQQYDFPPYKYYWDGVKWKTLGIGYNPVNDLRDEVLPTTREAIRRSYAEAGYVLVDGSFEEGGTLASANDVLLHKASGIAYSGSIGSVAAGTNPTVVGSGYVQRSDILLRGQLAGDSGLSLVASRRTALSRLVTLADRFERTVWAGEFCEMGGIVDDTAGLQSAIEFAESLFDASDSVLSKYPAKVLIIIDDAIRITSSIYVNGAKVAFRGPGAIHVDATGTYTDNFAIHVGDHDGSVSNGAYIGNSSAFMRDMLVQSTGRTVNLFKAKDTGTNPNDACCSLLPLDSCRISGFDKVFENGQSGWGWTFNSCGFNDNTTLLNLLPTASAPNTYERFSFTNCVWQNGGYAFNVNNPNGKVYWLGGSIDYCRGIGTISAGYVEVNAHMEYTARTEPLAVITSGRLTIRGGLLAILNETGATYNLFQQSSRFSLNIDGLDVLSDGSVTNAKISNLEFSHSAVRFGTTNATKLFQSPVYYAASLAQYTVATYGTGLTVTQSASSISVSSSVGAGGTKGITLDIPINTQGSTNLSWNMTVSNTSAGNLFLSKSLLSENKAELESFALGDVTITAGATNQIMDTDSNVKEIYGGVSYLRFNFNLNALGTGTSITISSLSPMVF